jgi:hypothetical protein
MLTELDAGVFAADDVLRLPGLHMPVRMGIVRLADGGLWIHSPIRRTDALAAEVAALGPVRYLVGPSHLHHLFIDEWARALPDAKVRTPEHHGRDDDPWRAEIASIAIAGAPKFNETVFFHRATRTLFVTDLLFNMRDVGGWLAPIVLRLMGVHRRLAQSRAWRFAVKDRAAFAEAGRRVVELGARRLVVAHGEIIHDLEDGALERALGWMLAGGARALAGAV